MLKWLENDPRWVWRAAFRKTISTGIADSILLQRELFISNSDDLPRIDGKPRSLLSDHCISAFKIMAHKWAFLQASGNLSQNFPSWVPKTAHLNNVCKGHGNGRCLELGHVYLYVEHGFRHLASYMKIIQVWRAHFQTSTVVLLIICFAYM